MSGEDMHAQVQRLFGPPGTGKTTELARRVGLTVAGLGPDSIRICSFSTTAAAAIGDRPGVRDRLPKGAVGTLHAQAYRACRIARHGGDEGDLKVALDAKVLGAWNETVSPTWRITGDSRGPRGLDSRDRAGAGAAESGDALLEQLDLLRARAVPSAEWPMPVRSFAKAWTGWKNENDAVDYTDMIVEAWKLATRDRIPMPGDPQVIVTDEAQDLTSIEAALTLAWGALLPADGGHLVFALDDDQAINEWRGGDPEVILGVDADSDEVLSLSWRVPPAVHAVAESWIRRVSTRFPKDYSPRAPSDRDPTPAHSRGFAHRVGHTLNSPSLVDAIEADLDDPDQPDATVMVIASCGYMLQPLIKALRERGIPFHNPYRPGEAAWNPLGRPEAGMSTVERIFRYLVLDERELGPESRLWTGEDIRAWAHLVSAKDAQFVHGAKRTIDALPSGTVAEQVISGLFRDTDAGDLALLRATAGGDDPCDHLEWLAEVITGTYERRAQYPLQVARTRGTAALATPPRVVLGTIHSTKGAEADRVYLAPDLSGAGQRQWHDSITGRDQIIRLFYVGMTRAYQSLRLLSPASSYTVPLPELLAPSLEVRP